jgi:hypothetical protein
VSISSLDIDIQRENLILVSCGSSKRQIGLLTPLRGYSYRRWISGGGDMESGVDAIGHGSVKTSKYLRLSRRTFAAMSLRQRIQR